MIIQFQQPIQEIVCLDNILILMVVLMDRQWANIRGNLETKI